MLSLDARERRILYELEQDARQPLSAIAKRVGISKQLTGYKIKRLEKTGVLEGYIAIIDTSRLGYTTYRVYFKLQYVDSSKQQEIIDSVTAMPEVTIVMTGDIAWDVAIAVMVENVYDFHDFWKRMMEHREFIETYQITIYSPVYHFTRTILSSNGNAIPKTLVLGGNDKVAFDARDMAILQLLAPSARTPLTSVARALESSPQLVINRVKEMERKGIIQGYRPVINWRLLGYDYYKVDITLLSHRRNDELFRFCKQHPNIFQVDKTIGGSDFEIELFANSRTEFKNILQGLQDRFHDVFRSYQYYIVGKAHKERFFPG